MDWRYKAELSIIILILLNILAVILGTVEALAVRYQSFFWWFEAFSVAVFTLEYIFRLWTYVPDERFKGAITGRLRYMASPLAVIDLLAVFPFYLPMLIPFDLRFLRLMRLMRLAAILKFGRYSRSLKTVNGVLSAKKDELLVAVTVCILLLVFSSCVMYFFEHEAQPDIFSSIPATMWWGVSTLTTVGYGDAYPITPIGKVFGGITAFLGIGLFALPTGILASGFGDVIKKGTVGQDVCPHCGKDII